MTTGAHFQDQNVNYARKAAISARAGAFSNIRKRGKDIRPAEKADGKGPFCRGLIIPALIKTVINAKRLSFLPI